MKIFHYTYILVGIKRINGRLANYIGKHTDAKPFGENKYYCSSTIIPDECKTSEYFRRELLDYFPTAEEALADEIRLHNLHDVGASPEYWNGAKQTAIGFATPPLKEHEVERAEAKLKAKDRVKSLRRNIKAREKDYLRKALRGMDGTDRKAKASEIKADRKAGRRASFDLATKIYKATLAEIGATKDSDRIQTEIGFNYPKQKIEWWRRKNRKN